MAIETYLNYRIVERKTGSGNFYYTIQRRYWLFWRDCLFDEVFDGGIGFKNIHCTKKAFANISEARDTLERILQKCEYRGIRIYPTVEPHKFYSLYGAERDNLHGFYVNLICGSYDSCCRQIAEHMAELTNRKHKKIIEL